MNNDFNLWEKIICKKAVIGTEFLAQTIIFYIHILQPDVGDLKHFKLGIWLNQII